MKEDPPAPHRLVPVADPAASYRRHATAVNAAVHRVLEGGTYILGPEVTAFEAEFAAYQEAGYAVGVANGTDALELALRAAGVGPGSAVATVANTVTATVTAIVACGATPHFVEIDPVTMTLCPRSLEQLLRRTRITAVVAVHLYGQPADLAGVGALARAHGAVVIEDCAQAHGARIGGRRVGTWGDFAAFSFYPTKNLGAFGDGGLVWCRDAAAAARVRELRQYGWIQRYVAAAPGRNSRLDELQAAILRVLLPALDRENERRRVIAARYFEAWGEMELQLPPADAGAVYHQFAVRTPRRDALREHLLAAGIQSAVLYPVPVHRQPAFASAVHLPETERACAQVLCLPVHPGLTDAEVGRVIAAVRAWKPA